MKNTLTTLTAVLGLGASLMAGAQAQTATGVINGTGNGSYQINLTESQVSAGIPSGQYGYQYVANLVSNTTGAPIDTFTFNFGNPNETLVSATGGGFGLSGTSPTNGVFQFSGTGLDLTPGADNSASFIFASPLPPTGAVAIGSTANNGSAAGGTGFIIAPDVAAVPEPGSLALLGLGALPLALVARRRKS